MKKYFKKGDIFSSETNDLTYYKVIDFIIWEDSQILKIRPTKLDINDCTQLIVIDCVTIQHYKKVTKPKMV